jgi:hypothetical protein
MDDKMTLTIREGVLNDDILYIANTNKVFKGGYIAILEYYTYLNEWNDKKQFKRFKSIDSAKKYISKKYPDFDDEIYQFSPDNE